MSNAYEELSHLDVSDFTEKKGKFTYLSWEDAVDVLLRKFPEATWIVREYDNGAPYVSTPAGCFVSVTLEINGVHRTQVHPVLNNYNKTIESPNAFEINTSIQRCLAKAIGLHGLGLYIYRGEDLPDDPQQVSPEPINQGHVDAAYNALKAIIDADVEVMDFKRVQGGWERLTNDERIAVQTKFGSDKPEGCKKGYKSIIKELLNMKEGDI